MSDFLGMGGYGAYVWSAYAVFFIVIVVDAIGPMLQRRSAIKHLRGRLRREAAKKSA